MPELITYRCSRCRKLMRMELGHGGDRCPICEVPGSFLQTIARVSERMRREHERALGSEKKARSA